MRNIIFRGKCIKSGEWVYGDLLQDAICKNKWISYKTVNSCIQPKEVIPETIGQYTGFTDKRGKEIFEGDICKFKSYSSYYVGKVLYKENDCSFGIWHEVVVGAYGEKDIKRVGLAWADNIKIIGNIYDNPELLKEGEK